MPWKAPFIILIFINEETKAYLGQARRQVRLKMIQAAGFFYNLKWWLHCLCHLFYEEKGQPQR